MTSKFLRQVNNRYQDYPAKILGCLYGCHGLTPAGSSAPPSHSLALPWWDEGENQEGESEEEVLWVDFNSKAKKSGMQAKQEWKFIPMVQPSLGELGTHTCNSDLGK